LTYGQPNLLAIEPLHAANNMDEQRLLTLAASLEIGSRHPIAHALLTATRQLHLPQAEQLEQVAGGGLQAMIEGKAYRLGHLSFVLDNANEQALVDSTPNLEQHHASTSVTLSQFDGHTWQPMAHFYFHDKVREAARATIDALTAQGINVLMLTGDPSEQAQLVAQRLGIETVYKGLTPQDKVEHLQALQQQGHVVQMVGDGVNDAPVLAAATISTAMAGAADLAQVTSDSLVLNGEIFSVAKAHQVARKTDHIIAQNFRWALGYNLVVLLPAAFGYVPPWLAAIGMSISSLFVVMNALRL
jgi:Cu2+-exporting ATPase